MFLRSQPKIIGVDPNNEETLLISTPSCSLNLQWEELPSTMWRRFEPPLVLGNIFSKPRVRTKTKRMLVLSLLKSFCLAHHISIQSTSSYRRQKWSNIYTHTYRLFSKTKHSIVNMVYGDLNDTGPTGSSGVVLLEGWP